MTGGSSEVTNARKRSRGSRKIIDVFDVAESQLCCGCGVCAALAPDEVVMVDDLDEGRRPMRIGAGTKAAEALAACPGVRLAHPSRSPEPDVSDDLWRDWGPVRAMWEGYTVDEDLRFKASSGGLISALASFALSQGFDGVVHIGADPVEPWRNRTHVSRTREEVEDRSGSRYSPASPGEALREVAAAAARVVFVGKPCDVAGAVMARDVQPGIARSLGLTIAMFCAGTPSLRGTLEMLQIMGVDDPSTVASLRYRGHGWPGSAVAETSANGAPPPRSLTYEESWGDILQRHRQWRCRICPDHTGEFADVSIGDPWYRPTAGDPGRSLVIARTPRGEQFVRSAIEHGVIRVRVSPHEHLPLSQPNLLSVRGQVWGRLLGMRLMGMPTPVYRNINMFHAWLWNLSFRDKLASILGTVRRIRRRDLARRRPVNPYKGSDS